MKSAKILLVVGLLIAGAGMVLPSAASAASPQAPPSAGPIGGLLATLQTPAGAGEFGHSVAVSGNTAVVGAPFTSVGSQTAAGTVYIYTKRSTGWRTQPIATLDDPPGLANDNFGISVAISGNTIVVGASGLSLPPGDAGAVYVYTKGAEGWPTAPTVTLPNPHASGGPENTDMFGISVAISGGTIVVGAPGDNSPSAAYIYAEGSAGWPTAPTVTLPVPGAVSDDLFGAWTAVSGGTVVIGAPGASKSLGAAYIYTRGTAGWPTNPSVSLANPRAPHGTGFGTSVAVAGRTILVGAHRYGTPGEGPVYIYTEGTAGWPTSPIVKLQDPLPGSHDGFGDAVAVSGGITVLGAFNATTSHSGLAPGRAWIYGRATAGWPKSPTVTLDPSGVGFGNAVGVQGTTAIIGALNGGVGGVVRIYRV